MNDKPKTTTIKIDKDNGRHDQRVPLGVNGSIVHLDVGKETPVGDHVLDALNNANIPYTVVSSDGEQGAADAGVASAAPVSTAEGTAQRLEVKNDENEGEDSEQNAREAPPELAEGDPADGALKVAIVADKSGETADGTPAKTTKAASKTTAAKKPAAKKAPAAKA